MNKKIFLASPHMMGNEQKYVKEAFDTNWIAPLGPFVTRFEEITKEYVGAKAAVALNSGTSGLHLALKLLKINKGDYVFCSDLTFIASVNPVMYEHAQPIFIDSESDSYNMSPIALRKAFEKYIPKAVIVVHLYGVSTNMDEIMDICNEYNVPVIEDATESLGTLYKDKHTGTFGKFGIFSYNGNKIITTSGGGMLISNDEEQIKKALFLATQAKEPVKHYEHKEIGYNYRLSNVSAAIGVGQMETLDKKILLKKGIYNRYQEAFKNIDSIKMWPIPKDCTSNYWLSCMIINEDCKIKPIEIINLLENENIESRPIWKPMHLQPVFQNYEFFSHDESNAISEKIFNQGLCLPSDTNMTIQEQNIIIEIIKEIFNNK